VRNYYSLHFFKYSQHGKLFHAQVVGRLSETCITC